NIAAYSVIKENATNNIYAGTSPLKILTGVNDYSGDMSFNPVVSDTLNAYIQKKQYDTLSQTLQKYNTSYVLVTKNIPQEVKESYLFGGGAKLKYQTDEFIDAISGKTVLRSKN